MSRIVNTTATMHYAPVDTIALRSRELFRERWNQMTDEQRCAADEIAVREGGEAYTVTNDCYLCIRVVSPSAPRDEVFRYYCWNPPMAAWLEREDLAWTWRS